MVKFKEYIPAFCDDREINRVEIEFSTGKELLSNSFFDRWRTQDNFSHFVKSDNMIMAIFDKGFFWWVIGSVTNNHFIDDIPEWDGGRYRCIKDGKIIEISADDFSSSCGNEVTLKNGEVLRIYRKKC